MPPNRKASLDQYDVLRFATVVHHTPAKDAVVPRTSTTDGETYWLWPTANHLFSANHMVANIIREASKDETNSYDEEHRAASSLSSSDEYWNPASTNTSTTALPHASQEAATNLDHNDYWTWSTFPQSAQQPDHMVAWHLRITMPTQEACHEMYWEGM